MERFVALLTELLNDQTPSTKEGRGRRRSHDREFALGCLVEIVGTDPDGLTLTQSTLVRRLARRFEDIGKPVPSGSWLKKTVISFRSWSRIRDQNTRAKWHSSDDLQAAFETAEDFASFCRTRDRLEEKWFRDKRLQERFATAGEYVAGTLATKDDGPPFAKNERGHKR